MEVLFKGTLNSAVDAIKCNYIIYWSGDHGMDLVDKWEGEGKIDDTNRNALATYWNLFEEYIHPQMKPIDSCSGTQVTIPSPWKTSTQKPYIWLSKQDTQGLPRIEFLGTLLLVEFPVTRLGARLSRKARMCP